MTTWEPLTVMTALPCALPTAVLANGVVTPSARSWDESTQPVLCVELGVPGHAPAHRIWLGSN